MEHIPENLLAKAKKATESLLPVKSRESYNKEYRVFVDWKHLNNVNEVNETVIMAYFQELSEKFSPNSLWTKYSILKSTLIVNDNCNIASYARLISFLKQNSKGYVPKKSKILTGEQVLKFIKDAPNEVHLMHKVVLVMGIFGGLRRDEMVKMTVDDVKDMGSVLLVKIPVTKTATSRTFTITEDEEIGALKIIREYAALRTKEMRDRRFFMTYRNNRCTAQPVGKNSIASVPSFIAKYLKLDNPKEYTGHCLRRTSSTLLVEGGASLDTLKRHGKCKSTAVAEGYVEDSMISKNRISKMIASSMGGSSNAEVDALMSVEKTASTSSNSSKTNVRREEITSLTESPVESQVSQIGPVSFSGSYENCNFYFGASIPEKNNV